ncbi:hypothetical protein [Hoeflea sp.]|uniref:ATP-binding protein n=1 Tax=Hoeflea sp. TaxID=1940281 RepID=UPI003B02C906
MRSGPDHSAVLLLGNYRPTLPLSEMFFRRDIYVIAGNEGCDHCAEYSRFVSEIWIHPKVADAKEFLSALTNLLRDRPEIKQIVPVEEAFVRFFAKHASDLPKHVRIAMADAQLAQTCLDKVELLGIAGAAGIPVAPYRLADSMDSLHDALKELSYPCVVRPEESANRLFGQKALTLHSDLDRDRWFGTWPAEQRSLLLQKKVGGIRHNCYFAADSGRICRYLHAIILRTDRQDGSGLAVEGKTIPPEPTILTYSRKLVAELGYTGIGCIQYLVDEERDEVHLLEINPRIAGNHVIPEYCGMALGEFLVDGADDAIRYGQPGIRYSWIAGDMEGFKSELLRGALGPGQAILWLGRMLRNAVRTNVDVMFNARDPLPGIVNLLDVIPGIGHITRLRRREGGARHLSRLVPKARPGISFIKAAGET